MKPVNKKEVQWTKNGKPYKQCMAKVFMRAGRKSELGTDIRETGHTEIFKTKTIVNAVKCC